MNAIAPILKTKLYIPRVRSDFVPRSRLADCLDQGLRRKLTLVSAPAGFGKTTLLSAWARGGEVPVAWLSLDAGDNDLTRFLTYILSALQTIDPHLGDDVFAELQSPQQPGVETVLTNLINEVLSIEEDFFLVLDDYHAITDQGVHAAVAYLIDNLPAQMHLILATRADPPIALARLRARGQLIELRLADLRFTIQEATEFLKRVTDLDLNEEAIATLFSRTEGWAAGLQMAAISIQGQQDTASFIQAFAGSHRYILDYLLEEVLQRQSKEIQAFLVQTSILDRLHGPLCEAVLGDGGREIGDKGEGIRDSRGDVQQILAYLESANLFVIPLDDQRAWYRYHRLFADLLSKRLKQTYPEVVPELHARASQWYQQNGFAAEAIQHAIAANHHDRAADLIEQAAEAVLMRGEIRTLTAWIEQLPVNLVRSQPYLDLYHVACLVLAGQPQEVVDANLERLKKHQHLAAELATLRAYVSLFQAEFSIAEVLSQDALETLVEESVFFRSLAKWIISMCQINVDDLDQRVETLETLVARSQKIDDLMFSVVSLCQLAEVRMNQGQLKLAGEIYQQAIEKATGADGVRLPIAGQAVIGLGVVLYELNDLQRAREHLEEGIKLAQRWRPFGAIEGYLALAMCRQDQGDQEGAQVAIFEARRLAEAFDATEIDDRIVAFIDAQLQLKGGDTQAIWRYLEESRAITERREREAAKPAKGEAGELFEARLYKYEQIALARATIAQNQPGEALAMLDSLLPFLERNNRIMMIIEVEILRSIALQLLDDHDGALLAMERALSLAEPEGYVRLFIQEGETVRLLIEDLRLQIRTRQKHGQDREGQRILDYGELLISAFSKPGLEISAISKINDQPSELIEPLSEREMEVLWYLRSRLTVPEIAQELYIAESTVRSHVKSIYSKLNVHRRMDAVRRGEELGLISGAGR